MRGWLYAPVLVCWWLVSGTNIIDENVKWCACACVVVVVVVLYLGGGRGGRGCLVSDAVFTALSTPYPSHTCRHCTPPFFSPAQESGFDSVVGLTSALAGAREQVGKLTALVENAAQAKGGDREAQDLLQVRSSW